MKFQTLPVKRRPVPQGMFRRLSAVTKNRRQRVAAAAPVGAGDMDVEDGSSKISRALTIIFLIHILAIGLIFVHQRFLDGRPADTGSTVAASDDAPGIKAEAPAAPREDLPRLASGEKPYIVRAGDNYARIAAAEGVEEADLRQVNRDVDIGPGLILKIPPKRIVAVEPKEVSEIRQKNRANDDRGLVEAVPVDVNNAPKARPAGHAAAVADPSSSAGGAYVVQPGDSVYRIATRYKVSQEALMRANQITDPRKMRAGMKLKIPQP